MATFIDNEYGKTAILSSYQRNPNQYGITINEIEKKEKKTMGKTYLASVATVEGFVNNNGALEHALSAKTLTDSTLGFTSTMEEVRAGIGGKLYGRFNHSTGMTVSLTDAMFDINYLRYQIGAQSEGDANTILHTNSATFTGAAMQTAFNLDDEPQSFGKSCGLQDVAIWAREAGGCGSSSDKDIMLIADKDFTFVGKAITLTDAGKAKIANDTKVYCITYVHVANGAEAYKVLAEFNPAEMILIMTANLYAGDAANAANGSKYGKFTVKIPRFQLDGAFDLSLAMTSAATMALNGTALAVEDGSCDGQGVYAEIVVSKDAEATESDFDMIALDPESAVAGAAPVVYGLSGGKVSLINGENISVTPASALNNGKFVSGASGTVAFKSGDVVSTTLVDSFTIA